MSHIHGPRPAYMTTACALALVGASLLPLTAMATTAPAPARAKAAKEKAQAFNAKAFYASNCASCHGASGEGGFGPALAKVEAKGDAHIVERVRSGSPKGMPPFGKLSKGDMKALVAFVKAL